MAIVQDAYFIPDDIATGLATGLYRRIGSVVRYATGSNKGQIVKHLDPIELNVAETSQGVGMKMIRFIQNHKTEVAIVTVTAAVIALGTWGYNKWKNYEPKALIEFRSSLKDYIEAIRTGNMNAGKIDNLMKTLDELKSHKNYHKISVQLTAEEMEILVDRIYDYTIKLANDNSVVLTEEELHIDDQENNSVIIKLHTYLRTQKKIFEAA